MASTESNAAQPPVVGVEQVAPVNTIPAVQSTALTTSEANSLLGQYGIDPNAVLSAPNIQQTTTAPAPAPDDLLGIRSYIYQNLGVNEKQSAFEAARKAVMDAQSQLDTENLQLRGRPVSVSKFTGQIGQNTMVKSQNIKNLGDAAQLALENLNAARSEGDKQFAIRESEIGQKRQLQASYPGAKIKLTDSFDDAIGKLDKYQKEAEKDAYKKTLKQKAMELGLNTSGSRKDLEKRIGKFNKSALDDAKKKSDLELERIKIDIANTKSQIGGRGGASETDIKSANENYIFNALSTAPRGADGFVDPTVWQQALVEWQGAGGSTTDFLTKFGGKVNEKGKRTGGFINPYDI